MSSPLIECVANFSEGRDPDRIDAIASVVHSVPGATVLHLTSDPDHHRSVITFAGPPDSVAEAGFRLARKASETIDLRVHQGVHPRMGALDVLPFVPLEGATLDECRHLAHNVGQRIWSELNVPVYFYESAAVAEERRPLEVVRRGGFEQPQLAPDLGGPALHPTAGAVIVGARPFLIAFNINLDSTDLELAKWIARTVRTSSGGFPAVKALGFRLTSRNLVQVSLNLTNFEITPLHVVFNAVSELAAKHGVSVLESELIGLMPRRAAEMTVGGLLKIPGFSGSQIVETRLQSLSPHPES